MKVLNLLTTGKIEIAVNNHAYVTEVTDPLFSEPHRTNLDNLVSSLQEQGLTELHIEQNNGREFVHKVKNGEVLSENDVNAYPVFSNLQEYANDLAVVADEREESANPHPWL